MRRKFQYLAAVVMVTVGLLVGHGVNRFPLEALRDSDVYQYHLFYWGSALITVLGCLWLATLGKK